MVTTVTPARIASSTRLMPLRRPPATVSATGHRLELVRLPAGYGRLPGRGRAGAPVGVRNAHGLELPRLDLAGHPLDDLMLGRSGLVPLDLAGPADPEAEDLKH